MGLIWVYLVQPGISSLRTKWAENPHVLFYDISISVHKFNTTVKRLRYQAKKGLKILPLNSRLPPQCPDRINSGSCPRHNFTFSLWCNQTDIILRQPVSQVIKLTLILTLHQLSSIQVHLLSLYFIRKDLLPTVIGLFQLRHGTKYRAISGVIFLVGRVD